MNKMEIEKLVEHIEEIAGGYFGIEMKRLNIVYNLKGTSAGTCYPDKKYDFNLYIAENNEGFEQTVWHEVAHQIAWQLYGRAERGHGRGWQRVMRKLGRKPSRCHSYKEVKLARVTKQYRYKCECGAVMTISSVRYNKQMRGRAIYSHNCGRKLDLSKAVLVRG